MGDKGTPSPPKLKSVSVKIGNFTKIGIGMLFLLEEKLASVSVRLKVSKSVGISIG